MVRESACISPEIKRATKRSLRKGDRTSFVVYTAMTRKKGVIAGLRR